MMLCGIKFVDKAVKLGNGVNGLLLVFLICLRGTAIMSLIS